MRIRTKVSLLLAATLVVAGCSDDGTAGPDSNTPVAGGELTVLLDAAFSGSWPAGLDPATNSTGGGNLTQMLSIYGGLFRLVADDDGSNAKVIPWQAESSTFEDEGKTLKIKIKPGITFTDGTDFNAEAVAFNIRRDMASTCSCRPTWNLAGDDNAAAITTEGDDTVVIKFEQPNVLAVEAFVVSNVNWIGSPKAIEDMGDDFAVKPVAAGPFTVVSNELSSELVLQKNPDYFMEGLPYLDKLTVRSIQGDQPAYQALAAGQAQAYEGMTNIPVLDSARSAGLQVTQQPATSPYVIQLNTKIPPFNDKRAREAIYYATNADAIGQGLFKGQYPLAQTFTAPGGKFHHATVDGYRTFDLDKAKAIVQELGGLTVDLGTLSAYVADAVNATLKTQWEAAGMTVTIHSEQLNGLVQNFLGGEWQAMLQTAGSWDPAVGVAVGFRFGSTSPFSGIADDTIDDLLQDGASTADEASRDATYVTIGERISDEAYAPYILAFAPASVAVQGAHGPGLTTPIPPVVVNAGILWDQVWMNQT